MKPLSLNLQCPDDKNPGTHDGKQTIDLDKLRRKAFYQTFKYCTGHGYKSEQGQNNYFFHVLSCRGLVTGLLYAP